MSLQTEASTQSLAWAMNYRRLRPIGQGKVLEFWVSIGEQTVCGKLRKKFPAGKCGKLILL